MTPDTLRQGDAYRTVMRGTAAVRVAGPESAG
ncbi:hypothetical protein FHS23_000204 [Prauserella isguenensis]|uniref:Uncharacterized protein n=1 Tax=Prauserella isguenensis TaxID=1470180 RepID=A0A839RX40_9PSEU|nr:hypothetical protein [Prauserella isguenensis]